MSISSVAPPSAAPNFQYGPNTANGSDTGSTLSSPWVVGAIGAAACAGLAGVGLMLCASAAGDAKRSAENRDRITEQINRHNAAQQTYNHDIAQSELADDEGAFDDDRSVVEGDHSQLLDGEDADSVQSEPHTEPPSAPPAEPGPTHWA